MKRILFLLSFMMSAASLSAENEGKKLAAMLQQYVEAGTAHPDSFAVYSARFERYKAEAITPQQRAMYSVILAHMYLDHKNNAQSQIQHTAAPIDSMQEWSQHDYVVASRRCYSEALSNLEMLYQMPMNDWTPLVLTGTDAHIFGHNMLYPIWEAMCEAQSTYAIYFNANKEVRTNYPLPSYADMIAFYERKGKREACFFLEMDSVMKQKEDRTENLQRIAQKYSDLNVCTEALWKIVDIDETGRRTEAQREQHYKQLQDILKRYPKSKSANKIRNMMIDEKSPELTLYIPESWLTGLNTQVAVARRNIDAYTLSIYHISEDCDDEDLEDYLSNYENLDMEEYHELKSLLKKNATLVSKTSSHIDKQESPFKIYQDTLNLKVSEHGLYLALVKYHTPIAVEEKSVSAMPFHATRLRAVAHEVGNDYRLTVVDAITGVPMPGVEVPVEWQKNTREQYDTLRSTLVTNERGFVTIESKEERKIVASLHHGDDHFHNEMIIQYDWKWKKNTDNEYISILNTDRSIYRPGQTINISAIIYRQHGWDAETLEKQQVRLQIKSPKSGIIADTTLVSDALGCVSYSMPLKKTAELGTYWITLGEEPCTSSCSIKVEEYKRPTFDVQIDKPVLSDSIIFTGKAMTFAGVPLRKACVTASYQWSRSSWEYYDSEIDEMPCPTVWTDNKGCFCIKVPRTFSPQELRNRRWVQLKVNVTHSNGETQSAEASASFNSTPLRMNVMMDVLQDKDNLKPWLFVLNDAINRNVEGEIHVVLKKEEEIVFSTTLQSQKKEIPHGLRDVPSGIYTLLAEAVVKGDTARTTQKIYVFSMHENTLPADIKFWCYCPDDKVSKEHPAQIQIGTSLDDVCMFYRVSTQDSIYQDEIVQVSHEVFNVTVPYDESMKHGASLLAFFAKDGKFYKAKIDLKTPKNDYKLETHWTTFRNKLQPGQHETWSLAVKRPDGSPANANVLLTMYDASLDALAKHSMRYYVDRSYIFGSSFYSHSDFHPTYNIVDIYPKEKYEYLWMFGTLNIKQLHKHSGQLRLRGTSNLPIMEVSFAAQSVGSKEFRGLGITSADEALQGRIAGLEIVPNLADDESQNIMGLAGVSPVTRTSLIENGIAGNTNITTDDAGKCTEAVDWSNIRRNFNEVAFYAPQLRTNEQGELTISFTLPQSLTRWHLLGVAHTHDMLTALLDDSIVAQKVLMAQLHLPRFLRVGDEAVLTATLQNIDSQKAESGSAFFEILDEQTEEVLERHKVQFQLNALCDTVYHFNYKAVDQHRSLICRWKAEGTTSSDGEQRLLPILTDKQTLTKSKVITLTDKGITTYNLQTLFPDDATQRNLTVEYTTHPIWCAIQALPTLFKPRHDDVFCHTSTFYAASLSQYLYDKVKDYDKMDTITIDSLEDIRTQAFSKLSELQNPDGSFAWFPGLSGSTYTTREVAFQLARLLYVTHHTDKEVEQMTDKALGFMRNELGKMSKSSTITTSTLRHLYIVSILGKALNANEQRLLKQLPSEAKEWSIEDQALASIVLHLQDKSRATNRLMEIVKKHLVGTPETGKHIEHLSGSFTSIDRKIHIHTQIMEALLMVNPDDKTLWNEMKQWLLMEKRTTDWGSCINTLDAIHALLACGTDDLNDNNEDVLTIKGKRYTLSLTPPSNAKGYLHSKVDISSPKSISIHKKSADTSWGAVYAEFEQPIDSVKDSWQGIHIRREMSAPQTSQDGKMHVGDKVYIRYVITAKHDFEYVMLHAPRPASAEPADQLSGSRYSNGLSFYRSVRDSSTDYYIAHLPKGTYVLEEECFIDRNGTYSMGIATIECLYAPEFRAYTGNVKIRPED